jgi:hypothetical protein
MSGLLTPATFEPHIGSEFSIASVADRVVVVLAAVNRLAPRSHGDRTEPFSIVFLGPSGDALPQATYTLQHPDLGDLAMFLVPIGPDRAGQQQYEAVFN